MSELQSLIDTPIGGVFFVSGAISLFILLFIFMLKKGNDLHSILGYIYFFGLCFANYAAAMAFYEGLLPLSAVAFTIPISTISIILGLASIVPTTKSLMAIRVHIISMCASSLSIVIGTLINWYHFNINLLVVFRWSDFGSLLVLISPILLVGGLITIYFLSTAIKYYNKIHGKLSLKVNTAEVPQQIKAGAREQSTIISIDPKTGAQEQGQRREGT